MAPMNSRKKVLLLASILVFLFSSTLLVCASQEDDKLPQIQNPSTFLSSRKMLELDEEAPQPKKTKSPTTQSSKNQTKLIKPPSNSSSSSSSKNQTKLIKPSSTSSSSKNQTKLIKPSSISSSSKNQTKLIKPSTSNSTKSSSSNIKTTLKKLNSTSKPSNSTKPTSLKTSDLTKPSSPKPKPKPKPKTTTKPTTNNKKPSWIEEDDDIDFVSDLTDLPTQFQQTLLPDIERLTTNSKLYLAKANTQMTQNFKPLVGNKYAPIIASLVSFAFLLIPLLLVSLLFNRIKAYFSLQKLLIFIHIYLSTYFSILSLSSLITSLEPLKFFYSTSQSTYICLQLLQTLGYVLYLLLLLMYLVLVFSTDSGLGSKMLGLAQCFVGFAIGLHYYMSVFHRAVMHLSPKTNWKVHGVYATCYFVICVAATMERRKKAYLEEGGEEGKKN